MLAEIGFTSPSLQHVSDFIKNRIEKEKISTGFQHSRVSTYLECTRNRGTQYPFPPAYRDFLRDVWVRVPRTGYVQGMGRYVPKRTNVPGTGTRTPPPGTRTSAT